MEVFKCEESVNLAHYFPYDVKLRLLAHSRSFLANQKARNTIVGAETLLRSIILLLVNFKLLFALSLLLKGLLSKHILKQIKGKFSNVFLEHFLGNTIQLKLETAFLQKEFHFMMQVF